MDFSYVLDSRFRGNDKKTPSPGGTFGPAGLSHWGRGEVLHSAKGLQVFFSPARRRTNGRSANTDELMHTAMEARFDR